MRAALLQMQLLLTCGVQQMGSPVIGWLQRGMSKGV
jgi:hypothetical protein